MNQNYTPIDDLLQKDNATPVSVLPQKEVEPVPAKRVESVLHEVTEHKMSEEVKDYIQHRDETVQVPPDLSNLGVSPVGTPNYVSLNPKKLPLSDDSIIKGLHAPIKSSLRWLAAACLYVLRKTHVALKEVHGKIVRVAS
jgi:hypothetical protein